MVQHGDVIEIQSSPEPSHHLPIPTGTRSRDKGKGRATPYRLALASSVIELTDSDSESEPQLVTPTGRSQSRFDSYSRPGPSSSQKRKNKTSIPNLNFYRSKPAGSLTVPQQQNDVLVFDSGAGSSSSFVAAAPDPRTEAGPSNQITIPAKAVDHNPPLFLASDEEYGPPAPLPSTTHVERVEVGVTNDPSERELDPQSQIQPSTLDRVPTPELDPIPIKDVDPTSIAVAQILEIIPNVEPTHLLKLIETHLPTFSVFHGDHDLAGGEGVAAAEVREATVEERVQGVVGHVLHLLFENPDYPKADLRTGGKGKGKRLGEADDEAEMGAKGKGKGKGKEREVPFKKPKIDYASVDRPFPGGLNYFDLALYHLQISFPQIPKPYLRRQLQIHRSLYAPTHLFISAVEKGFQEKNQKDRPYNIKSTRASLREPQGDAAFEEEKTWLDAELAGQNAPGEDTATNDVDEDVVVGDADDGEDDGAGIECQCCFADYPFSKMVQCPEAHLFCSTCISTYASTQLGSHNSSLTCIHPSSCSLPFPPSELQRILPAKLYELYERLEQQKEIMQAGLVGLEECPFCEWKCVLEASSEEDKLFRCGNEEGGCGVVSCRGCKQLDHLPKSCKEVEEDKHLDGRHAIEEAMTRALMRNCPKCQKAFIKDQGCNKMHCPNCHTLSCYVCRQVITGYDHFNQPGRRSTSADAKKCLLWDAVEERHAQEVKEAAEKAMEEYKRDHPDVDESAIKVDVPVANQGLVAPLAGVNRAFPAVLPAVYNPIPNPFIGRAHVYPNLFPAQPPPQARVRYGQQAVVNRHQPALEQPQLGPNTRARAAIAEEAQRQQRKRVVNSRAERARMAEQVRIAEEDNRARQRAARLAMEMERERRRQAQGQGQGHHQPLQAFHHLAHLPYPPERRR